MQDGGRGGAPDVILGGQRLPDGDGERQRVARLTRHPLRQRPHLHLRRFSIKTRHHEFVNASTWFGARAINFFCQLPHLRHRAMAHLL